MEEQLLFEEIGAAIGQLVTKLVRIADDYEYDRNAVISVAANSFLTMSEVCTFENYEVVNREN
jgi:hypothetical protein